METIYLEGDDTVTIEPTSEPCQLQSNGTVYCFTESSLRALVVGHIENFRGRVRGLIRTAMEEH